MEIYLFILAVVIFAGLAYRKAKADEAARDAAFEATMRALEEKAKRQGTFVVSYFDTKKK